MYKGNDIIGKPIITFDTGVTVERIKDVLFDAPKRRVLGFLVDEEGVFRNARIVPFGNVRTIGKDAITVENNQAIVEAARESGLREAVETKKVVRGTKVMTESGTDLGAITDLYFDEATGEIRGYEVSGGVFADVYSGKSFLPAPATLKIGQDVAFVPTDVEKLMKEQTGGIKGAAQEIGKSTTESVEQARQSVRDTASRAGRSAQEQTSKFRQRTQEFTSEQLAQQTVGKRAHAPIYARNGSLLIATGQIVTEADMKLVEAEGRQVDLVKSIAGGSLTQVDRRTSEGVQSFKEAAGSVWDRVRQKASKFKEQAAGNLEENRIQAALGKPVTRVVLDKGDNVILKTGQLITNESVERARRAGVLDMLLNSVAKDKPKFSSEELKSKGINNH